MSLTSPALRTKAKEYKVHFSIFPTPVEVVLCLCASLMMEFSLYDC